MDENIDEKMDQSVLESTANAEQQDNVNEAEQSTFYTANEQSSAEEVNAGIVEEGVQNEEVISGNNGEEPSRQEEQSAEEKQDAKVDGDEKSNNDNMKKNKVDDDGEVASDGEENGKKIEAVKNRKRPREKTLAEQYSEEPRTKKAALEQLKNMRFAAKDPFKENPLRDRPTMMSRHRERTPPRKLSREEEPRRRARDEPSAGGSRRRRSRSRSRGPGGGGSGRQKQQQIDTTTESRHQRSTMFFLQNEQRAAAMAKQPRAAMPTKPLRDRIEMLLARPDSEIIALPAAEIRNLIVRGIDLYKEHEYFLTGRKAQLIELDAMIGREREDIERISQELPPQYRPPMFDEFVSNRRGNPQQPQNAPSNYSIPPPGMDNNEFRPPNSMQMPPPIPPSAGQFARPPPQFPPPFPSNPAAGAALPHFGQSPSLLFSKPPPSTAPTTKDANIPPTNTAIPPPNLPTDMQPSQSQSHSLVQNAPPPPLPSTFSIPPPKIGGANSQEQPPIGQQPKAPQPMTQIPSLLSQPPPNILINNAIGQKPTTTGFPTISSAAATAPSFTPIQPNMSIPPPSVQQSIAMSVPPQPPTATNTITTVAMAQHQQIQQKQQQMAGTMSTTAAAAVAVNFASLRSPPMANMSSSSSSMTNTNTTTATGSGSGTSTASSTGTPAKPPPRPLMSINVGFHHPSQSPQMRQPSPSRIPPPPTMRQPQPTSGGGGSGSAEMTQAVGLGAGGSGRGVRGGGSRGGRRQQSPRMGGGRGGSGGGRGRQISARTRQAPARKRFSSSPSPRTPPSQWEGGGGGGAAAAAEADSMVEEGAENEAANFEEEGQRMDTTSSYDIGTGGDGDQQADSSTNFMEMMMENAEENGQNGEGEGQEQGEEGNGDQRPAAANDSYQKMVAGTTNEAEPTIYDDQQPTTIQPSSFFTGPTTPKGNGGGEPGDQEPSGGVVLQAADTTISSNDEMLPVSP